MQRDSPTDSVTRQAGNGTNPAGTLERGVHRPCGLGAMDRKGCFRLMLRLSPGLRFKRRSADVW